MVIVTAIVHAIVGLEVALVLGVYVLLTVSIDVAIVEYGLCFC